MKATSVVPKICLPAHEIALFERKTTCFLMQIKQICTFLYIFDIFTSEKRHFWTEIDTIHNKLCLFVSKNAICWSKPRIKTITLRFCKVYCQSTQQKTQQNSMYEVSCIEREVHGAPLW